MKNPDDYGRLARANGSCSAVLNPTGAYYKEIKAALEVEYEDNYWAEDAVFMERNSRNFVSRIQEINSNAEAICDVLRTDDLGGCRISNARSYVDVYSDIPQ